MEGAPSRVETELPREIGDERVRVKRRNRGGERDSECIVGCVVGVIRCVL